MLVATSRDWRILRGFISVGTRLACHSSEIAITQSAYPDSIKKAICMPQIAPTGPIRDALDYALDSRMAASGPDPLQASPEKGAKVDRECRNRAPSRIRRVLKRALCFREIGGWYCIVALTATP